jgi:hypothetical protein
MAKEAWLLGLDCRPRCWRTPFVFFERREKSSHVESEISNGVVISDRVA